MDALDACIRSIGILNPEDTIPVTIIGCGSIGSFSALALAKMGFNSFTLFDGDTVGPENIGCQLFGEDDIGKKKTFALANLLCRLSPDIDVLSLPCRVNKNTRLQGDIVISAVDSMAIRSIIWERLDDTKLFIDGRIGGQLIRVFSVNPNHSGDREFYGGTLYTDEDAEDLPCTERNVADVAFFVGGIVARAARLYISDDILSRETCLDVRNFMGYTIGLVQDASSILREEPMNVEVW